MRTALCVMAVLLTAGAATSEAEQRRDVRRHEARDERARIDDRYYDRRNDLHGDVRVIFSRGDVRIVREYYAPHYRRLPPGLAKKYARTGHLPPGWQRKIQPLPWAVERRLSVLPDGYRRGYIDDHAVIYAPRTGMIIDATIVF